MCLQYVSENKLVSRLVKKHVQISVQAFCSGGALFKNADFLPKLGVNPVSGEKQHDFKIICPGWRGLLSSPYILA